MGGKKNNLKTLEQRVKNAKGQVSRALLIEYFTALSEEEQAPMLGLDRRNRIIFANEQAIGLFGSDPTGMGIPELEKQGMLKEEDVKDFNDLARKTARYNYIQFQLMGMNVKTQVLWYKNGNYKCGIVRFKRPSLTKRLLSGLASRLPSIFHKTKFGFGKYFPDAENPQYEIVESETSDGAVHIHLETMVERVTSEMAKTSITTLNQYVNALLDKQEPIDIIIDLTESSKIDRKAIYNYAVLAYRTQRAFPGKVQFHFHADRRSENHYADYVKAPIYYPGLARWNQTLDDFKISSLRHAVSIAVHELKYLNTEEADNMTEKEVAQAVRKEYREIFRTMLEESKLYWHIPPEQRKKRGLPEQDIIAQKSETFIQNMTLGLRERWFAFAELISNFSKMNTKSRNAEIYQLFNSVFERYIREVYPEPKFPEHLKGEKPKQEIKNIEEAAGKTKL